MEHQMHIGGKTVMVFPCSTAEAPVIYLNTFGHEGGQVYNMLRDTCSIDFSMVAISDLAWDHDMAPWDIPPISKDDVPCTGGADDYLKFLITRIIPEAEKLIPYPVSWRGLTGYSLAGLFSIYSIYRTDVFSRIASMSGSLWFPGFPEYVFSHEMKKEPECVFFSLGDKERRTQNPYLIPVQANTEKIESYYRKKGIDTIFKLNHGGHFKDAAKRTAAGIEWILSRM